ncbi:MAG: YbaN family protein [Alkaliphilus sp.]|nr:YbaN family protein [Alkaliphilus sp.]
MIVKSIKKYFLIFAGSASLTFGIVGIFIPMLPTTPFLLLASYCYVRSSKRLYDWLINHKFFGAYIYNYLTYRAVKRSTKIVALLFLWLSLTISIFIMANLHIKLLLIAIGIGVSTHILLLKTLDFALLKESERKAVIQEIELDHE